MPQCTQLSAALKQTKPVMKPEENPRGIPYFTGEVAIDSLHAHQPAHQPAQQLAHDATVWHHGVGVLGRRHGASEHGQRRRSSQRSCVSGCGIVAPSPSAKQEQCDWRRSQRASTATIISRTHKMAKCVPKNKKKLDEIRRYLEQDLDNPKAENWITPELVYGKIRTMDDWAGIRHNEYGEWAGHVKFDKRRFLQYLATARSEKREIKLWIQSTPFGVNHRYPSRTSSTSPTALHGAAGTKTLSQLLR